MPQKMHPKALDSGYRVQWFSIERVLGQGDFGVTYLAHDSILDRHVAIKEYLPVKLALREGAALVRPANEDCSEQYLAGLELFIDEARLLAKVEHPNIVRVLNVFVSNNTAYMVMGYEEGESLEAVLERRRTLEHGELLRFLIPVLNGLEKIHNAGFVHCDVTPANILLRKDGSPVLLDFGAARQSLGEKTQTLPSMLSPGYAAIEQYYGKSDQLGPWTDIYGLGATLYRSIAGIAPPDALERSQSVILASKDIVVAARQVGGPRYSEGLLRAIDHALNLNPPKRPQCIAAWRREFSLAPELPVEDEPKRPEPMPESVLAAEPAAAPARRPAAGGGRSQALAISLLALIAVVGLVWLNRGSIGEHESPTASSGAEQSPSRDDSATGDQATAVAPHEIAPTDSPAESADGADTRAREDSQGGQEDRADAVFALLAQAGEDIRAGRLISPKDNNALVKFRSVLAVDPDQPQAKQGIREIIDRFAQPAREAMAREDWAQAETRIDQVVIVLPEAETLRQELNTRRAEAEKRSSEAKAAQGTVEPVAAIPPENKQGAQASSEEKTPDTPPDGQKAAAEEATPGSKAARRTINLAWRALKRKEWDQAKAYIDQAEEALGDAKDVRILRRQLISRQAKAEQSKQAEATEVKPENTETPERAPQAAVKIQSAAAIPAQVSPGETVEFVTTYNLTLPPGVRDTEVEITWVLKAGGKRIGQEGSDLKLATAGINSATTDLAIPGYMKPGRYTVEHSVRAGDSNDLTRAYFTVVRKPRKASDESAPGEVRQTAPE